MPSPAAGRDDLPGPLYEPYVDQESAPEYEFANCRYSTKRAYASKEQATHGAYRIRLGVEAHGGVYTQLYPYACPDNPDHWHLSHYPQGTTTCPVCEEEVPSWFGGMVWVISAHKHKGQRCSGEGHRFQ